MTECTSYEAPLVNTNGGVLAFNTGISEQDFIDNFGLVSPNIVLNVLTTEDQIVVTNTLDHHEGPISFDVILTGSVFSYRFDGFGEPLIIAVLPDIGLYYRLSVNYKDLTTNQVLRYVISYAKDALRQASATVCIPPIADNTVRLPIVKPTVKPNIYGFVYMTDDMTYVSQIDVWIELAFNGCQDGLLEQNSKYTYYDFPLQCVMKGVGTSVKEKFDSIVTRCPNLNLNYEHFLQYSVLRVAIAAQSACVPFSVQLLRRRLEPEFKASLQTGPFSKYYDWFYESSVARYWKLFDY